MNCQAFFEATEGNQRPLVPRHFWKAIHFESTAHLSFAVVYLIVPYISLWTRHCRAAKTMCERSAQSCHSCPGWGVSECCLESASKHVLLSDTLRCSARTSGGTGCAQCTAQSQQ